MAPEGELIDWNDQRGFGFISPDGGGPRLFVHISQIDRIATRPRLGDRVSYTLGRGRDGGAAAVDVRIAGANPLRGHAAMRGAQAERPARSSSQSWLRAYVGLALAAMVVVGWLVQSLPPVMAGAYLVMSAASAWLYYSDKQSAATGAWRTSENLLHGMDLCFGIIGGLLAQQVFRHKTAKPGFAATTYVIATVHGLWLIGVMSGFIALPSFAGPIPN